MGPIFCDKEELDKAKEEGVFHSREWNGHKSAGMRITNWRYYKLFVKLKGKIRTGAGES